MLSAHALLASQNRPTSWHSAEADSGDGVALLLRARRIHLTKGLSKADADRKQFELRLAAAKAKFPRAMVEVGVALAFGEGVEADPAAAEMWLRRAWTLGQEPDALYNLGLLGLNDRARWPASLELFRRAAAAGCQDAYYNLGVAYHRGAGVEQDLIEAARWFELDASPEAAAKLAEIFGAATEAHPDGDQVAVAKWQRRGCVAGSITACRQLAGSAARGGDRTAAIKWLTAAARLGDSSAYRDLASLARADAANAEAGAERSLGAGSEPEPDRAAQHSAAGRAEL